ncbi:hypothetical protein SBI67_08075 [Mycolicibacterium sp. 120266]|nr:hypothetical protein [Mycolicibacterium sp. 120266]MDX1872073.1 hypothetical protein [Mycolicibacterium sp. 120266]
MHIGIGRTIGWDAIRPVGVLGGRVADPHVPAEQRARAGGLEFVLNATRHVGISQRVGFDNPPAVDFAGAHPPSNVEARLTAAYGFDEFVAVGGASIISAETDVIGNWMRADPVAWPGDEVEHRRGRATDKAAT